MNDTGTDHISLVAKTVSFGRFIRNWVRNPLTTGAIAPSGAALAHKMASFVPLTSNLPVLEIGPGTGSVTHALLERGIAPSSLYALEYNQEFVEHIRISYPQVRVFQGDAYHLAATLKEQFGLAPRFRAIVSSLPLLTQPQQQRQALLLSCLAHLEVGAPVIQFSYGWKEPVLAPPNVTMEKTGWITRNIPPARVFVYRMAQRDR